MDDYYRTPGIADTHLPRPVLTDPLDLHIVEPCHLLPNAWEAPFLFEDSRHLFFVTSEEQQVWIRDPLGYGAVVNPGLTEVLEIPPLVLQPPAPVKLRPQLWGDSGAIGADLGVTDSTPMRQFVTEDAYIRRGIGATGDVLYGSRQIGPAGADRAER
jgi:hypothetical protein